MSSALHASRAFETPEVSQTEIDSFHDAHFSNGAVDLFAHQFLQPENAHHDDQYNDEYGEYYEEEEDDGLGWYPDGVKRTLTDEQIAIFRHSEIEAMHRVEAKVAKLRKESAALLQEANDEDAAVSSAGPAAKIEDGVGIEERMDDANSASEDGEIETEKPKLTKAEVRRRKKQRAKQKKQQQQKFNPEKKPDLRKRTWDVVEAGMDTLDYDELETAQNAAPNPATQRRRISYDD